METSRWPGISTATGRRTSPYGEPPDNTTLTDKNRIQDVKIYSYPSMTEVPQSTPWYLWYQAEDFYFDTNGTDPTPPGPFPWSETDGYLNVSMGSLPESFYKGVVTDYSGRQHEVWLGYTPPTEVSKVLESSMGVTGNPDGSVTLSWTNPTLDPTHIIRLYVRSTVDSSGDGYDDVLLMVHLPYTSNSYTIPAAEVTRLKGFSGLYWYVEIRERIPNVENPDGTTKTYDIYRNYGQTQALSLP